MKGKRREDSKFFILKLTVLLGTSIFATQILANPVLGNIGAGNVSVQQTPNSTVVNQSSQKAILNWQSFNIGAQEATHFNQPAGGVALNRISPQQGASQIYGRLTATGQIILVNPAGIYFGPSAYVNVGGLIATTANIADENFLSGNYIFNQPSSFAGASIINEGTIIAAQHGLVALVGSNVTNNGMIQADYGHVVLASGKAFTMSFAGNDLINFTLTESAEKGSSVNNNGSLIANGGHILVTAKQASAVLDNVINLKGVVQAKSVYEKDGEIIISGDPNGGVVNVAANVDASGNEKGGTINITGYNILIDSPAVINASGNLGGGNINIGGNYQGQGVLPNANAVVMMPGASIYADAITNGKGGNVILWANNFTKAYGQISARGGSEGGDGGFIETSGKNYLDVNGISVNTSAPFGSAGMWLLDPTNIYIADNQANATAAGMTGTDTSINSSGPSTFNASGAVQDSLLLVSTLENALLSNNVGVNTTNASGTGIGDITVVDPITWATSFQLNLNAAHDIFINGAITTGSGGGSALILNVGNTGSQTAAIGGSGFLFKSGAGTFNLSQANTYSGGTIVNTGILSVQNASGLGSGGVSITSGATLEIANGLTISNNISSMFGTGVSGNGALRCLGNCTWSGFVNTSTATITSNAAASTFSFTGGINIFASQTVTFDGAGDFSVNGAAINGTLGNIVKDSSGTLTLSTANSYTGTTTVNAGILDIQNSSALGTTGGATTVASGAALQIDGSGLNIAEAITLNGSGISSGGALRNLANNNTWSGAITLGSAASIVSDAGTLTLSGGISGSANLTISGSGNTSITTTGINTGSGATLTKSGTGTLTVAASSNYTGNTLLQAGTISLQNNSGLGSANNVQVSSGATLELINGISISNAVFLAGTGVSGNGAVSCLGNCALNAVVSITPSSATIVSNTAGSTVTFGNTISLTSGDLTLDGAGNFSHTGTALVGTNSLIKNGSGTFVLAQNSPSVYSGTTTINGGTLQVGNGSSTGYIGTGNIINDASLVFNRSNALTINNTISGTGTLTQAGSGTLALSGTNTYSGATIINAGTLSADSAQALGTTASGTTVNSGAALTINGVAIGNEAITLNGGTLNGVGTASLNGNISLTAATANIIDSNSGNFTLNGTIDGNAALTLQGAGTLTLGNNIGSGTALSSLTANRALTLAGNLAFSAATIDLNNGVNGGFNLTLNGTDISVAGALTLANLTANGTGGTNSFTLDTGNSQTWTITAANSGSFSTSGISGSGSFSNIQNLTGGSGSDDFTINGGTLSGTLNGGASIDSLTGDNVANTWVLTGANSGTVTGIAGGFISIENLFGSSNTDSFALNGGTLSGSLNGGTGTDSLTGDNVANTWVLTGANSGTVTGITGGFSSIENLVGGSSTDSFTLNGGTLSGSLNGGTGSDSLTGDNVANTWVLTGANSGTVTGIAGGFSSIENLVGGSSTDSFALNGGTLSGSLNGGTGSDSLTGDNVANTWVLTGANSGTVTGITGGFSSIENLVGGSNSDSFALNGGTLSGSLNGGAGSDSLTGDNIANTWVLTAADAGTVTGIGGGFFSIENLTGGSNSDSFTLNGGTLSGSLSGGTGSDSLTGDNVANTWVLTAADAGTVTGIGGGFSSIENLVGGSNSDSFTLNGGTLSGSLSGGTGSDSLTGDNVANTWVLTAADAGTVTGIGGGFSSIENLTGGSNSDSFTLNGGTLSGAINGGAGSDSLTGDNVANTWVLTAANTGTVTGIGGGFSSIENLTGGSSTDSFTLNGGTLSGNINGGAGSDTLTADNVANTWNITGTDTGTVTGVGGSFTSIENLVGGNNSDNFVFADASSISGVINGGSGSTANTLDYTAYTTPLAIALSSPVSSGTVRNNSSQLITSFSNIFDLIGNPGTGNTLNAPSGSSNNPTGPNSGIVNGTLAFSGFSFFIPTPPVPPVPPSPTNLSNSFISSILEQGDSEGYGPAIGSQDDVLLSLNDAIALLQNMYDGQLRRLTINPYCGGI